MRQLCLLLAFVVLFTSRSFSAITADLKPITTVERQPFVAATARLMEALTYVGAPLNEEDTQALKAAMAETDERKSVTAIQEVLDPHCLAVVKINAESRVSAVEGPSQSSAAIDSRLCTRRVTSR